MIRILSVYGGLLLRAMGQTLLLALCGLFFACILGLIFGLLSVVKNRVCNIISTIFVDVIRGVPMIVLAYMIFFGIPQFVNGMMPTGVKFTLTALQAGTIALALNCGAYMAEIIRAGIQSVDPGQMEAARSLGLNYTQATWRVILPQTIKNVFPSLGNELIVLLKETSISGYIALQDLTKAGDIVRSRTYSAFFPYISVAAIYLVLVLILEKILGNIEGRLAASDR